MSLLYLGIGRSVFVAPHMETASHKHGTFQLTLSLAGPFSLRHGKREWTSTHAAMIRPGAPHELRRFDGPCVTMKLIPEFWRAPRLSRVFADGQDVKFLDGFDLSDYVDFFRSLAGRNVPCYRVFRACDEIIEEVTGGGVIKGPVDDRLLVVLDHIQQNLGHRISVRSLAQRIFLSEDRFMHLFKSQLGLPVRQYILNQRILRASAEMIAGSTVTQAAHDAGFSDSSHLTRRFVEFTGVRPSRIKTLRGKVRIFSCSSSRCIRPSAQATPVDLCQQCRLYHDHTLPISRKTPSPYESAPPAPAER